MGASQHHAFDAAAGCKPGGCETNPLTGRVAATQNGGQVENSQSASLGSSLAPALIEQCGGRLSHIEWFRAVWQRGGAATGYACWKQDDGEELDVLVKLPVGPAEHNWTVRLSELNGRYSPPAEAGHLGNHYPTPRILASGLSVGGHDLAWLVMERLHGHTLTNGWCKASLEQLLRAAAIMQARAAAIEPVLARPAAYDWDSVLRRARHIAREFVLPEAQQWNDALKKAKKALPKIAARWEARPIDTWCHGDLHPGNAMHRDENAEQCVLIDLALVHPGHWVEDAIYLERQFWGRPDALFGIHPVSQLARYRRELGLPTDGDYGTLANLRRVLMAACAPVTVAGDGHPRYMHAALEMLERLLPQVSR